MLGPVLLGMRAPPTLTPTRPKKPLCTKQRQSRGLLRERLWHLLRPQASIREKLMLFPRHYLESRPQVLTGASLAVRLSM